MGTIGVGEFTIMYRGGALEKTNKAFHHYQFMIFTKKKLLHTTEGQFFTNQ